MTCAPLVVFGGLVGSVVTSISPEATSRPVIHLVVYWIAATISTTIALGIIVRSLLNAHGGT